MNYNDIVESWNNFFSSGNINRLYTHLVSNAAIWILVYSLVCVIIYTYKIFKNNIVAIGKRVLLVTAHPDDESMFFGPCIVKLKERGVEVHILCLSNGDHGGLGSKRHTELWKACSILDITDSHIVLVKDTRLPDDPMIRWPVKHLSQIILNQLISNNCDTLITFDRDGVSGHANHSSLFYALAYMFVEGKVPDNCQVFVLDSVNVFRKYWSYFDLPISLLMSQHSYFLPWRESTTVVAAMKQHKSQMVWFRYLYVTFSRYIVLNTLRRITKDDIELELTIED